MLTPEFFRPSRGEPEHISQLVVFLVGANPSPDEHFAIETSNRAIMITDPRRPFAMTVWAEAQRRMTSVAEPKAEIFPGQRLYFSGQFVVALPKFRRCF